MTDNPAKAMALPKKDAAGRKTVSRDEVVALLAAARRLYPKRRAELAHALVSTLVYTGVRFSELLNLKLGDVNMAESNILVTDGKGAKSRRLYPPPVCMEAIAAWLAVRGDCTNDWLWAEGKTRRTGEICIRSLLEAVKAAAGLSGQDNVKPHSLRHFFATNLVNNGASLKVVQSALGHNHLVTTAIYVHADEEETKKMAEFAVVKLAEPMPSEQDASIPNPVTELVLKTPKTLDPPQDTLPEAEKPAQTVPVSSGSSLRKTL